MKSFVLSLLFCFCITVSARANDGPVFITPEGLKMISEDRVKLTKEKIVIRLYSYKSLKGLRSKGGYKLRFKADFDCRLDFENVSDKTVRTKLAFPFNEYLVQNIFDYHIFAGPCEIPFRKREDLKIDEEEYSTVFLSDFSFQPRTTTRIRHCYSYSSLDFGTPLIYLEYIFSTGKKWKKSRTQCDVIVLLDKHLLPYISIIQPEGFQVISRNRIEWHLDDLPDEDLYLEFRDDDDHYIYYSVKISSEDHDRILREPDEEDYSSKLKKVLHDPDISVPLRNYIFYLLSKEYLPDNPKKAIPYMKKLAEYTECEDLYNLNNLIESLLRQGDLSEARSYLDLLAGQKRSPGFSIYAQLILREHGLRNGPLDLEFPTRRKWRDRKHNPDPLTKSELIIGLSILILVSLLVLFILWRILTWISGRTLRWKKKS